MGNYIVQIRENSSARCSTDIGISFDSLRNEMEKDIFLKVYSIFVCKSRAYVTKILNRSGVVVLRERSLKKLKKNNKYGMHPWLQEMGREIVRDIPRKDAKLAASEINGTKVIQRLPAKLFLTRRRCNETYPLEIRYKSKPLKLARNPGYLSKKRNWISLHGFSSKSLPNHIYLHDAISIDLKHSLLRLDWEKLQVLAWVKVLNLSHSKYLTDTPDFSRLPGLEQLILKNCPRLFEIHQSIGCLYNLMLLNLKNCTSLSNLPEEIYKLKSLKTLILSGCSKISLLEKDIVQMESLIIIMAENTVVKQVPFSIVSSKSMGYISLRRFEGLSHNLFPSIIRFWMSPTMNPLSYIHSF
ncbi:TMV resistance protein N-like isoform X2 [Vigna unguiculata]|uniref:TMV resistance protein N-like isoform X2 n=1 Tax=Vigna unguiculata TaxID=3917 RepID=UPI00101618C9|nr:TMV resistance protein N-like isoform X2 [Vigna unguiculata]